jgi:hydroxymethylglutaryl-CoA synthase
MVRLKISKIIHRGEILEFGIVSYGVYVPRYRITPQEIGKIWGADGDAISKGMNIKAKSVPSPDEDVTTISVEAARMALRRSSVDPGDIGAIYIGSESHPYSVKPTATIVAQAIQAAPNLTAADFEFACKAGTAAMQACMGLVGSEIIKYGFAIGADTAQGAPGNALEYTASAGGAALLIGGENLIATINGTISYTTDTPDFWRREGMKYPSHGERFTGKPAYFKHSAACAGNLMEKMGTKPEDYQYAIFHQPNGKFPLRIAKMMGFNKDQVATGLLTPIIGNTYSASSMLGLCSVLDEAKPGDRVFMVSYGSGAGSDGFDITVTDKINDINRTAENLLQNQISRTKILDYGTYAKFREKIKLEGE